MTPIPTKIPKNEILLSVAQGLQARTITMTPDEIGTYNAGEAATYGAGQGRGLK